MAETNSQFRCVRFGAFEADLRTGELRKDGVKLKFSGHPFQVLAILLERPGELVTREELQERLWPSTFVDVERNLNTAVNKIREMLGDSAESPRFVETLPRRGYRFIAPVEDEIPLAVEPTVAAPPPAEPQRWGRKMLYVMALLGVVSLAVGALVVWTASRKSGTPKVLRFAKLTNDGHRKFGPMVSDGVRVYFTEVLPDARNSIVQVPVTGGEVIPLSVSLKQPSVFDLSRDGTELLLGNLEGNQGFSLWVQPVAGGSPRRVGEFIAQDAAFDTDNSSVLYAQERDVFSVKQDGSSDRKLLTAENVPHYFRFSPDKKVLRFSEFDSSTLFDPGVPRNTLMSADPDGENLQKMFKGCCGEWTTDGRFFVFRKATNGHLDFWTLRDKKKLSWQKQDDQPIQLTTGPFDFEYSLPSKNGKEIFAIGNNSNAEVIRYDSRSRKFVPYLFGLSAEGLAFSPDGNWVTYTSYPEKILWRSRLDGTQRRQLTFPPMVTMEPRWSPDGKQISFSAAVPGTTLNIYLISSDGGTAERLVTSDQTQVDAGWSPDGRSLIFGSVDDPKRAIDIVDIASRRISTLPGSSGFFSPHWSPDGKYISATISQTEKLMLLDVSAHKWMKPCDCSVGYPNWSRDGKYLYFQYFTGPSESYRIVRLRMSDNRIEVVADLSSVGRLTAGTVGEWFGLAPDDSPLLARDLSTQEIYALEMEWP